MSKQSDAVRAYIEQHCLIQREVAEKMGISPASFNNMLAGRDPIGKRRALKLHELFGFDIVFLVTGEGSLFGDGNTQHSVRVEANHNTGTNHQSVTVSHPDTNAAALKAQVETLKAENEWLRQMVSKLTEK